MQRFFKAAPADDGPPFDVKVRDEGGVVNVAPSGDLDMLTASRFEEALGEATDGYRRALVLDLAGLSFIDSTGLSVVSTTARRCRREGVELVITPGSPNVQRVFAVTGLESVLPFRRSAA